MPITDYPRKKQLDVENRSGTPTVGKAQPVLVRGENSAYEIKNPEYTGNSLNTQDSLPTGITFNNDGTKLFEAGAGSDLIYEYNLGTAYDITTATYTGNSLNTQDSAPLGITFNNDGTKLFEVGAGSDLIYEYNLGTAYDITTATATGNTLATQDSVPTGITFNNDGTKLFEAGAGSDLIYEYNLSTAYDITTATYTGNSLNTQDSDPRGITFNNDGTKLFEVGNGSDLIYEYNLVATDQKTGNGDIVIDFTNISDAQDIAVYDQNGNLLDYEIESLSKRLIDDFEDGDITGWTGDTTNFTAQNGNVLSETTSGELNATTETVAVTSPQVTYGANNLQFELEWDYNNLASGDYLRLEVFSLGTRVGYIELESDTNNIYWFNGSNNDLGVNWTSSVKDDFELQFDLVNDQVEVFINSSSVGTFNLENNPTDFETKGVDQVKLENKTIGDNIDDFSNGYIDDIRLDDGTETATLWCYNSWVRDGSTQAQIAYGSNSANTDRQNPEAVWPTDSGPKYQANYHLNESSGATLDSTSNSNDSINTVGTTYGVDAQYSEGREFDGTDDGVQFGHNTSLDVQSGDFSISAWVKTDDITKRQSILHKKADSTADSGLEYYLVLSDGSYNASTNGEPVFVFGDGSNLQIHPAGSEDAVSNGEWNLITAVYDQTNDEVRIYVNGTEIYSASETASPINNDGKLEIGEHQNSTDNRDALFDGVIDEARVYGSAVAAEMEKAEYDASPKAGQVFFSQQAAEDTVQTTTDTAVATSYTINPVTSSETNNRFDNATKTVYNLSPQTSTELNNAFDSAAATGYSMTPNTSVDNSYENFNDTAVATNYSLTSNTSTEVQVNIDTAVATGYTLSPQTSTEEQTNVDTATATNYSMASQTSTELNNAFDSAAATSYTLTPQTSQETVDFFDTAVATGYSMGSNTSSEAQVTIEVAQSTGYSMTANTSTETVIIKGQTIQLTTEAKQVYRITTEAKQVYRINTEAKE